MVGADVEEGVVVVPGGEEALPDDNISTTSVRDRLLYTEHGGGRHQLVSCSTPHHSIISFLLIL